MFYVYILRSIPTGRFYTGSTQNIAARLEKHNAGHSTATLSIIFSGAYKRRVREAPASG
jgi:predicted GIY-YIG superfamily endonuclease